MSPRLPLLAAALLATTAACDDGDGPAPPPPELDGDYALTSTIDIQAGAFVPVDGVFELLQGLRDEPGRTLFDLAEAAGVPAVGTVRDALPGALESRVYGWIDDHVKGVTNGDGPLARGIDTALAAAESVLTQVELTSDLSLLDGEAIHALREATFELPGRSATFDLSALGGTPIALSARTTARLDDGALLLGSHSFGLPLGRLAYQALEDDLRARYGTDLRGLLGAVVDCPEMAAEVADRCALGVCVGHEDDLLAICDAGLDRLVDEVAGRFAEMDVEVLALRAGRATPVFGADGTVVELAAGAWTAQIDVGAGLKNAPATFAGVRR